LIPRTAHRTYRLLACTLAFLPTVTTSCRDHSAPAPVAKALVRPAIQPLDQDAPESDDEKSCHNAVQDFYNWYFDLLEKNDQGKKIDTESSVLRIKPNLLGTELEQLLAEDEKAAAHNPGYIVGLDFDPYLNAQDWEGRYQVTSASVVAGTCKAVVSGRDAGKSRDMVIPELRKEQGRWIFVNFHYPGVTTPSDENLIAELKSLRSERESHKMKGAHK
jgi:Protein of unknown function (DUF3828)